MVGSNSIRIIVLESFNQVENKTQKFENRAMKIGK